MLHSFQRGPPGGLIVGVRVMLGVLLPVLLICAFSPGGLRWLRASECGPCACCDAARAWRLCGFGILPNKFLQRKGPCMYRAIACKSSVLYIRLPCLQALGPLQEHTTFRESLVCYTSPPGGVYVLGVLPGVSIIQSA